ncbi:hypothetical protein XENOCAPTIV_015210 [Xenoophorus captivus]|uniref:PH domain-containing protein n=1 Tax=Xenoophorus captivus TaxID=1517983 RepID=A0ABV0RLJ6_9TELE
MWADYKASRYVFTAAFQLVRYKKTTMLHLFMFVYQGKITAQGKLLQQDTFTVIEQDSGFLSRAKERRVFLFEQLVIFSEPIDRKKGFSIPGYIFKSSIKVSCLGVEPSVDGDDARFVLTSRNPDGSVVRYQLQGSSGEICRGWVNDVVQILESQRNFLNGNVNNL